MYLGRRYISVFSALQIADRSGKMEQENEMNNGSGYMRTRIVQPIVQGRAEVQRGEWMAGKDKDTIECGSFDSETK